jgi:hypothetical protein
MIKSSILLSAKTGYAGLTQFTATSNSISDTSIQKYAWSTGDGNDYLDLSKIVHPYRYAGTYTITLTVWDQNNNKDTSSVTVNVEPILNEGVYFLNIPKSLPGPDLKTETPFTVSFVTALTGITPIIGLFADGSSSIPDNSIPKSTWKEITPTWYFTDTNGNKVTELTATNTTKLYRENTFIGLSGTVDFYFYEKYGIVDPFIQTPTTLLATLKTSNVTPDLLATQNNLQKSTLWYTDRPIPEKLSITENHIREINQLKWSGVDIPYLITANYGNKLNVTKSPEISSSIAFNLPDTGTSNSINKTVIGGADHTFKSADSAFVKAVNGLPTGGFINDSVNIQVNTPTTAQISASVVVDTVNVNSSVFTNTFLPIFNSDNATLAEVHVLPHPPTDVRVAKLKLDQILETEYRENFNLESFFVDISSRPTGIYSIATDPTDFTYWVTDSDRIRIYKFDRNNNILANIDLNQYFDTPFVTNNNKEKYLRVCPLQIVMDKDKNLYVSFVNDFNILKFDKQGNLITVIDYGINVLDSCNPTPYYPDSIRANNPSVFSLIEVDKDNNLWVTHTNIVKNELRKYTTVGKLLTAIQLKPVYTPTNIHCDNNNNIWITSQVAPFLIKPSQDIYQQYWNWHDLGPTYGNNPLRWVDTRNIGISSSILGVEFYPPGKHPKRWQRENLTYETLNSLVLDTITIDNIVTSDGKNLVSESTTGSPCEIKYIGSESFNNQEIKIDRQTFANYIKNDYGVIYKFSSNVELLTALDSFFIKPELIVSDHKNNIWVTHNNNSFSVITSGYDITTWKIQDRSIIRSNNLDDNLPLSVNTITPGLTSTFTSGITSTFTQTPRVNYPALTGIRTVDTVHNGGIRGMHVDFFNRVWLVNNPDTTAYCFYSPFLTKYYRVYNANIGNDRFNIKTIQSFGDPTGGKWYTKYIKPVIASTVRYVLSGMSTAFTVKPFEASPNIRIQNESFDAAGQMKSFALPEHIKNNTTLFDVLLPNILGPVSSNKDNIGRRTYEKIANFTDTHSNIDTANIQGLKSLAAMLDTDINYTDVTYPTELLRLLNIVSMPYKKLFGEQLTTLNLPSSPATLLTNNSTVSAGDTLLINFRRNNDKLVYEVPVNDKLGKTALLPLSTLQIPALKDYIFNDYEIYKLTPAYTNTINNNIIDFDSPYTTLTHNTCIDDWFKEDGIIEEMFNYILTKNLFS